MTPVIKKLPIYVLFGLITFWVVLNVLSSTGSEDGEVLSGSFTTIPRKLMVIIFNPILSNGQKLTTYKGWPDPDQIVTDNINWLYQTSNHEFQYTVTSRIENNLVSGIPKKEDGFQYDEATYLSCINESVLNCHFPDIADYTLILNQNDVCTKLNNGEIDELWLFGGPWMGFYESRLAGPGGFYYNSDPLTTGITCNKLIPIMGINYERGDDGISHGLGHRAEATMSEVYGDWAQDRMNHNWDKFALDAAQSPSFGYSGCGSIHFPPNGVLDYDYSNSAIEQSYCYDFINYPNLHDPATVLQDITCTAWGCSEAGYLNWWFQQLPQFPGYGPDDKLMDWWHYIVDPNSVLSNDPIPTPTPTVTPTISPSFGVVSVYRFWSDQNQVHFYTSDPVERDQVINNYDDFTWKFEGEAFKSIGYNGSCQQPGSIPVYRFWSDQNQVHFYTLSSTERDIVINNYDDFIWKYEGIAYCAFSTQVNGRIPVYRFWSDENQSHFYTSSLSEKSFLEENYNDFTWRYEGIGYYALQ